MTIISEGEASSDSAMFLHAQGYLTESLCATAGADGHLGSPFSSNQPFATFTVATPVRYVSGTVTDENGKGVDGATVRLNGHEWEETIYEATTDAEGQYQMRIEEGNKTYGKSAAASGHTSYDATVLQYSVLENPTIDFTLYGSVTYPANRQSSIVLPVAPDPTAGKYYKLVGREGIKFIFEREQTPKANVPYVLFANKDYRVDLADMDLSVIPGRIDLDSLSMIGSYSNGVYSTASYISMPLDELSNTGSAMHAHLYGHFSLLMDNYELVFNDLDTNAIQTTSTSLPDANTYNLLGLRLTGKPNRKGIYIQNGRKVAVK